jgi:hypothetical protein
VLGGEHEWSFPTLDFLSRQPSNTATGN